jgi:glycosyltransferase involved in cell wall biosynthesis
MGNSLRYSKRKKAKVKGIPNEYELVKPVQTGTKKVKPMQGAKSRRYKKQMEKIRAKTRGATVDDMGFNIRPGMASWVDMPKKYKNEYYKWAKVQNAREEAQEEMRIAKRMPTPEAAKAAIEKMKRSRKKPMEVNIEKSVANFIDNKYFEKLTRKKPEKPLAKVLLITDVCGWAWWNKSRYLQHYLGDEFDIDVVCVLGPERGGINAGKYDLYLTFGYSYVGYLKRVAKRKRITGITAHRPKNMLLGAMRQANYLHANSKMLLSELKGMADQGQTCFYVPNGVDHNLFKPVDPLHTEGQLVAGHVGKQCHAKGQAEFIIPAMKAAGIESTYNVKDYRNRLPYTEMWQYYQTMDVFMVASIEDGTPNGALEAAACGRPIISNRIGNMPEFIKDGWNGFLVDRKLNHYIEKLEYLDKNRDHLVEMGKNARKTIEEAWTWEHQAENYRKMFCEILGIK